MRDRAGQAEAFGAGPAPRHRGLAAGAVVGEGLAGEVVGSVEDGIAVVADRSGSHDLRTRHRRLASRPNQSGVALVFSFRFLVWAVMPGRIGDRKSVV